MVVNVSGNYLLQLNSDTFILNTSGIYLECKTSGAPVNITLPRITDVDGLTTTWGFKIYINDADNNASLNNITVTPHPADKINGALSMPIVLATNGETGHLQVTGTNSWEFSIGNAGGGSGIPYGNDTGAVNAVQVSIPNATLTAGYTFEVRIANTNTGASTLQTNALGVLPLVDTDLNPLSADMMVADSIYLFAYNLEINKYELLGLAKPSYAPPIFRYVYLVEDPSDAIRMGGTPNNTYTTFQTAYNGANALQLSHGGKVVIMGGNITAGAVGDCIGWSNPNILISGLGASVSVLGNLSGSSLSSFDAFGVTIGDVTVNQSFNIRGSDLVLGKLRATTTSIGGGASYSVDGIFGKINIASIIVPAQRDDAGLLTIQNGVTVIGDILANYTAQDLESLSSCNINIFNHCFIGGNITTLTADSGFDGSTAGNITIQNYCQVVGTVYSVINDGFSASGSVTGNVIVSTNSIVGNVVCEASWNGTITNPMGTLYNTGNFFGVTFSGGSGSGAQASVQINGGGQVIGIFLTNAGIGYMSGDVLTINNGSGINFATGAPLTSSGAFATFTLTTHSLGGVGNVTITDSIITGELLLETNFTNSPSISISDTKLGSFNYTTATGGTINIGTLTWNRVKVSGTVVVSNTGGNGSMGTFNMNNCILQSTVAITYGNTVTTAILHWSDNQFDDAVTFTSGTHLFTNYTFKGNLVNQAIPIYDNINNYNIGTLTLTVDVYASFVGKALLDGFTGETITNIIVTGSNTSFGFEGNIIQYQLDGGSAVFTGTAIAGILANQIALNVASYTVFGRTDGSDYLTLERDGNFNRFISASILI